MENFLAVVALDGDLPSDSCDDVAEGTEVAGDPIGLFSFIVWYTPWPNPTGPKDFV
jgi:hypothetical protein